MWYLYGPNKFLDLEYLKLGFTLTDYVLYYSKKERSSSPIYLRDRAILALQSTAGHSIRLKCFAPTLKHLKRFMEELNEYRQSSATGPNVHFIKIRGKVFKVGWKMVRIPIQNLLASDFLSAEVFCQNVRKV